MQMTGQVECKWVVKWSEILHRTMTQAETSSETGIHGTQLCRMAEAYGFKFLPPVNNEHSNLVHNQSGPIADARNVERIAVTHYRIETTFNPLVP